MTSDNLIASTRYSGFSLIECLIATLLFTISCLGIFSLYQNQVQVTLSLVNWHAGAQHASLKTRELQREAQSGYASVQGIANDSGGQLPAGKFTVSGDGSVNEMHRHWKVTTLKSGYAPIKFATVTVTWSAGQDTASVSRQIPLWFQGHNTKPLADNLNPHGNAM